jgi:hypothetical protein
VDNSGCGAARRDGGARAAGSGARATLAAPTLPLLRCGADAPRARAALRWASSARMASCWCAPCRGVAPRCAGRRHAGRQLALALSRLTPHVRCRLQGVEKLVVSKMMVEGSNRRIHTVDRHAGLARARAARQQLRGCARRRTLLATACASRADAPRPPRPRAQAVAGLAPDGRVLVTRARGEAAQYLRRGPHCARLAPGFPCSRQPPRR